MRRSTICTSTVRITAVGCSLQHVSLSQRTVVRAFVVDCNVCAIGRGYSRCMQLLCDITRRMRRGMRCGMSALHAVRCSQVLWSRGRCRSSSAHWYGGQRISMLSKATLPWRSASSSTRNVRLLTAILSTVHTCAVGRCLLRSMLQRSRHQCNIQRVLWTTAPLLRLLRTLHGCHSTRQCVVYSQYPIAYVLRHCTDGLGCDVCSAE